MKAERRQHRRHRVPDIRIEIFSRETKIIGTLEIISKTGLAFHYAPISGENAEFNPIDIMATGPARFYLSGLVFRRIYDISAL